MANINPVFISVWMWLRHFRTPEINGAAVPVSEMKTGGPFKTLLLIVLFVLGITELGNAQPCPTASISYAGTPFCTSSAPVSVTLTGSTGGIFSSTPGLSIDAVTGDITPALSVSGTYTVTYTIPPVGVCPVFTTTTPVTITSTPAPTGPATQLFCATALPTVANLSATGSNIKWYAASSGGTALDPSTALVTATHYYATQTIGSCESLVRLDVTVTVNANVIINPFSPATSTRCQGAGSVTTTTTAVNNTGPIVYSIDATSAAFGVTILPLTGNVTYPATWSGITIITASAPGCSGPVTTTHTVTTTPTVTIAPFSPVTSTRCQGAGTVFYTTTATNNSLPIVYSLDAASIIGGNIIDPATGALTYNASWNGTTVITATAAGCNGPAVTTHTATTLSSVSIAPFNPATSTRCQGSGSVTYTTTALNNTIPIVYSLDPVSLLGGNTIDGNTGTVNYAPGWSGTTIITATATGCNLPATTTHTVTVEPAVIVIPFSPATSVRCYGAGTVSYSTTAVNNTGPVVYSLDPLSLAGGNTIDSGTGDVTYDPSWSGITTITASADGCNGTASTTHVVTVAFSVSISPFSPPTSERCQGAGTVTYTTTATNNLAPLIYSLDVTSLGAGNQIDALTGEVTYVADWFGTTTITAEALGCDGPVFTSHVVTVQPLTGPAGSIAGTPVVCQGEAGVAYSVPPIPYATGYVWTLPAGASITSGSNTNSIIVNFSTSASSGIIKVYGTNSCSDGAVSPDYNVSVNTMPLATATNNGPVCAGNTLSLTGPAGMATYLWTGPLGFSSTLQSPIVSANATVGMSGTYTLVVTNAAGCTSLPATTVATVNALPVATAANNGPVCEGSTLSLTGPTGMATYLWTGPLGFSSTLQSPIISANATVGMSGTYTLVVTNGEGCISLPATTVATVNALPVATAANNGPICAGTTLNLIGPAGMNTYLWTGPLGYTSTLQSPTVSANATVGMSGTYSLVVTDATGCSSLPANTIVTVNALPVATASNNGPVCAGTTLSLTGPAGMATYLWTGPLGFSSTLQSPIVSANATVGMSGTYTLVVTNAAGCTSLPATTVATVNALPVATAANNGPVCEGTTLSLTGPAGMNTYLWTGPLGYTSTLQSPTVSANATVGMSGTYTLVVTNAAGCTSLPATTIATVNALPVATAANNGPVCEGTTLSLTGPAGMNTYLWTGPLGYTSTLQSPTVSANATIGMSGTYNLIVTNASGCSSLPATTVATVNALPAPSFTVQPGAAACSATDLTYTTQPGESNYTWTFSGVLGTDYTITSGGTVADNTVTLKWLTTGPKTVTINYSNAAGCTAASPISSIPTLISLEPTIADAGSDQTDISTCGLTVVTLSANNPVNGTGLWSIISGTGGNVTVPSNPVSTFTGTAGTSYLLRWTISNPPCTPSFDDVNITFNQNPTTADAGPDQTGAATCGLTTVTLAANSPVIGTGSWIVVSGAGGSFGNSSLPGTTFTGIAGISYVLRWTITNSPCAASSDDVNITFNQNPTIADAGPDQTDAATCGMTTVTLAANIPVVGTGSWSIVSGTGGTITDPASPISTFSGIAGNTYSLRWTITNPPCAPSSDDVNITFNQNPTIADAGSDQTGILMCGITSTVLAANTPSAGTGTWTIISGTGGNFSDANSPTSTFTGTTGMSYVLRWTISNPPCADSFDEVNITFNQNPEPSFTSEPGAMACSGTDVTYATQPGQSNYTWTYTGLAGTDYTIISGGSSTDNFVTVNWLTAGYKTVTINYSNAEGCTAPAATSSVPTMINTTLPVSVSIAVDANPVCDGTNVTFTATPVNGGVTPAYQWFNGSTPVGTDSPVYSYIPADGDMITVVLTSSETCQSGGPATSNAVAMIVNPLLPVSVNISADANPVCDGATVNLTATPVNGGIAPTYQWYNGAAPVGTDSPVYSYVPADGDVITVVLTSSETCQSGGPATSNPVTITVNPLLPVSVNISADANPVCDGATVNFTATPVNGGLNPSYQWYNNSSPVGTDSPAFSYVPADGDIFTVVLTSDEICQVGGPATSNAIVMSLTTNLPVSVTISADVNPVCSGTMVNFTATPVNGGINPSYQWYNGATAVGTDSPSYSYSPSDGDVITVVLTSSEICQTGSPATSNGVTMNVNSVPAVIITDPPALCSPDLADLTDLSITAGSTPGLNYTYWTDAAATISYPTPASATTGTYYIMGTDPVTGCFDIKPVKVIVNDSPTVTLVKTDILCTGSLTGAIDITTAGGTAPFTYAWTGSGVVPDSEDQLNLAAGDYSVIITDSNGCYASASTTLNEPTTSLSGSISSQTDVSVYGGNDGSVTVDGSGGTPPYLYKLDSAPYQVSGTFASLTAGSYIVTVQDANMCTFDVPVTIMQPPPPLFGSVTSLTNVACFGSLTGSVTVAGTGGVPPYDYSLDSGPFQSSGTFGSLAAGDYTVTVRDSFLKTYDVAFKVTEPGSAVSALIISQTDVICFGSSTGIVTVEASGGISPYQYKLNSGPYQDSGTFGSLAAGNYIIRAQDSNLCTIDVPVTISQPATGTTGNIIDKTNVSCSGSSNGSFTVEASGGNQPYQYSLDGSVFQSSGSFSGLAAGTYTVIINDSNLCIATIQVDISEPDVLSLSFIKSEASCPGEPDGSITLTVTGGTQPYNIIWEDGASSATRTGIPDGTYSAVVTDLNGCAESITITVGVNGSERCLEIPDLITPNNDGYNDTWKIKNIDLFPDAEVFIYTRWGKLVFRSRNLSAEPWDGRYNGKLLPTDSYHYILHLNNGSEPRSGVISIIR